MLPDGLTAAAPAASTPAGATAKPKGRKPPAAPPSPTNSVSSAAGGSTGGSGSAPAPAPGEDVLKLRKTASPDEVLALQQVSDDLGMFAGALTTVPGANEMLGLTPPPTAPKAEPVAVKATVPTDLGGTINIPGGTIHVPGPVVDMPQQSDVDRAERKAMLPEQRRLRGKNADKVEPMSWNEYERLPEMQRAAVDFNTMLTNAVKRDRNLKDEYNPDDTQKETYRRAVVDMFGTNGGSNLYAPETMAVLQQLDVKDMSADLDDFLKLKVAITEDDLKKIDATGGFLQMGGQPDTVQAIQSDLAGKTHGLERELAQGGMMLQSAALSARTARNADPLFQKFGGIPKPTLGKVSAGYGLTQDDPTGDVDAQFQMMYRDIATSGKEAPKKLDDIMSKLDPAYAEKFMSYLDNYSLQNQRYGISNEGWTSPEEFRTLLGLAPKPKQEARNGS